MFWWGLVIGLTVGFIVGALIIIKLLGFGRC